MTRLCGGIERLYQKETYSEKTTKVKEQMDFTASFMFQKFKKNESITVLITAFTHVHVHVHDIKPQ